MDAEKKEFLQHRCIELLRNADTNAAPRWGKMNFQQMVEHMVLAVKSANGKIKTEQMITPPDKVTAFQDFLRSDKDFRENTKSPALPEDPLPLHFASVDEAINKLESEIAQFFHVYETDPQRTIRNPIFGDLDASLALNLLYKHAQHHLKQFGLL